MSTLSHPLDPSDAAPPPPAPPLPPQRYGNRAANAIARFAQPFISRPPSAGGGRPPDATSTRLRPRTSSSLSSKTSTHKTGIPIAALDRSPDGTHAILAGREILKTVQVSGSSCVEDFNLRSHIIAYAAAHNHSGSAVSAKHKDHLAANDVKWSAGQYDSTIATAAANGQVVIYDINRPGVELARLHEHNRQVHKLAFNSHQGALLLSGSQDATVRLWDLRQLGGGRSVATCGSAHRYSLNNEGIRDLKWSPTNGVEFAAGTDNGVIQRWDFRKEKSPLLRVNAHEKTCHSVDWHPDGKHLVSGGADKTLKVWDFSSTNRRMKPSCQLQAPQAVVNVCWRPACWTFNTQIPGSWQAVQLATSYDHQDCRIHVWDLRRPYIPFREVDQYSTPATAILWHSENLLWSVGSAGIFTQTDMTRVSKVLDKRSPNVIAVAPNGQINIFSEQRSKPGRSFEDLSDDFLQGSRWPGGSGERLSSSHSVTDGSFEEPSLLSTSVKSRQQKPASTLSSKSAASTPPSAGTGGPVLRLDESLQKQMLYRPSQVAAIGHVPGVFDDRSFEFLARNYRTPPAAPGQNIEWNLHELFGSILEHNAAIAAYVGQHRLAQSWRILALAVTKELKARAETNRALRMSGKRSAQNPSKRKQSEELHSTHYDSSKPGEDGVYNSLAAPSAQENGSNMTTPLARPISDPPIGTDKARNIPAVVEETFRLPLPAFAKQSPRKHHPVSDLAKLKSLHDTQTPSQDEQIDLENPTSPLLDPGIASNFPTQAPLAPGFPDLDHQMSERRAAMSNYRAQPRPLLTLDDPFYAQREGLLHAPSLGRHDSNESFQMFSASTDSSHCAGSMGASFGSNQEPEISGSSPERQRTGDSMSSEEQLNDTISEMFFEDDESRLPTENNPSRYHGSSDPMGLSTSKLAASSLLRPVNPQPPIIHTGDLEIPSDALAITQPSSPKSFFIPSDFDLLDEMLPTKPWNATAMLSRLITYHTTMLSDAQTPSHLILYFLPYFSLSMPQPLITSILLSYHNQLTSLSLHSQAAHLRNLCYPIYPEIYDHGTYGITSGGAWCTTCRKPNKGDSQGYCERCRHRWAPCPICNGEGPIATPRPLSHEDDTYTDLHTLSASDALWGWCQGCGHGGHSGCLRFWWDDAPISEGGCATMGCLHDCVAGIRRDERLQKAAREKKAGTVKGDDWIVGESRAAEKARDLLGNGNTGRGGRRTHGPGPGQTSAGGISGVGLWSRSNSGSGSIGKKVRLVVPEGGGEGEASESKEVTSASAP